MTQLTHSHNERRGARAPARRHHARRLRGRTTARRQPRTGTHRPCAPLCIAIHACRSPSHPLAPRVWEGSHVSHPTGHTRVLTRTKSTRRRRRRRATAAPSGPFGNASKYKERQNSPTLHHEFLAHHANSLSLSLSLCPEVDWKCTRSHAPIELTCGTPPPNSSAAAPTTTNADSSATAGIDSTERRPELDRLERGEE